MSDAHYEEIVRLAYFANTNIRTISKSGVLHFVSFCSGFGARSPGTAAGGLACGANSKTVVQMDKGYLEVARSHLASQEMSEAALDSKIRNKRKWYKIVIRIFTHQSIVLFMDTSKVRKDFCWIVTIVKSKFSKQQYCQLT